ncbi:BgtA-20140 [Blumeria graminis f. sp. tritici]|uniref:BgtA-20140 n=2 Tax=Blumeria graminis f. sp. tritici TaxID=62690 RepID=A0A9X9MPP6_BLUGR|nr:hypothetical protein BGT96224_A20140 [Blumeria graminis f. sp. tritici 96224]VDB94613.1 BgtA-20140 [Blumeria graminis f. sp. tritici]
MRDTYTGSQEELSQETAHISSPLRPNKRSNSSPQARSTLELSGSSKRPKISDTPVSTPKLDMNKDKNTNAFTTRPIDLTGTLYFEPSYGAKRLQIRNLRTTPRKDAAEYYTRMREEIDSALSSVFANGKPELPLEVLCRGVEFTCRHGQAEELFTYYRDRSKDYLENELLSQIKCETSSTPVETLRTVYKFWISWFKKSTLLRSIFSYLDRSYLLNSKDLPNLEELSIQQFRHAIFEKGYDLGGMNLGERVITDICDLIDYNRSGKIPLFDESLFRESIRMLHIFGIYNKQFEPLFLDQSRKFFETYVQTHRDQGTENYIPACDTLIAREKKLYDTYNFDSITKKTLQDLAYSHLIIGCSDILLDKSGLQKLIDQDNIQLLKVLYDLLSLSNIHTKLRTPFEEYIKFTGSLIVKNTEKPDEMVIRLLELRGLTDKVIRDAFSMNETFTYSLRDAFRNFINDKNNLEAWNTKGSKVGEMLAKYMDMLLRGGLKAVPQSLLSDSHKQATTEKKGQADVGDDDAELDRQLEQALELFRFIEGKDIFEAFYKKDFARRLLMARSACQDAERNMLAKLKVECGCTFTQNLEQMFKDMETSRDEMTAYRKSLKKSKKETIDLQVNILYEAAWPSYPEVVVNLPPEVAVHVEKFDNFYTKKHSGRRLTWKNSLAHCVIKAQFNKGAKELLVSAFQAIVLVLFNNVKPSDPLSYSTIQQVTGLVDLELQRTLQSLACAKFRVLTKHPKGREVNITDTFTVNTNFTDAKYKVKINQIQLKETKEDNVETHEKVFRDRQYETQAAIVRIMKSHKTMTHSNLISEVIEQTKGRGAVEISEIKSNIDKLIDKEYLERENGGSYVYCA